VDELSGSYIGGAISFDAGYNNGAVIPSPGSMSLSNCVFDSNSSQFGGSAIATFDGGTATIDSCTFTNNGVAFPNSTSSTGGAIFIGETPDAGTTTIKNSTFVKNVADSGGAIGFIGGTPTCVIHNCVIANNTSSGEGGGIVTLGAMTIDQGTIISNNVSAGINNGDAEGGGIQISGGPVTISNCTIVSNVCSLTSTVQRGGGGIAVSAGPVTVSNCRIFGNVAATGSGLLKDLNPGNVTANNNWWGNNGGPGVGGADTAVVGGPGSGGGTLTLTTWLVMSFSATPTTVLTSGTSSLSASITKNSANATGFTIPNGTPVNFAGVLGTVSPASTTLTSSAAAAAYTAGSVGGTGSASATIDAQTLSAQITVNQPPAFTNANSTTFTVGTAGSFKIGASGVPAPTLSTNVADVLPSGVSFNTTTGVLSGAPAAGTGGTYTLHLTANNGAGTPATQTFTLTVNEAASITSVNNKTFTVGSAGTFTAMASGFPTPTLTESGALPTGVNFSGGTLAGTPAAGTGGTYPITFTAHNGVGTDASQPFTLIVDQAPSVICPGGVVTNATGGTCLPPSVTFAATASGFPTPTLLYALNASAITSPHIFAVGTNVVTVTATNAVGADSCSFTVVVTAGAGPELNLVQQGTNVVISWSTNFSCYTLQFSSAPSAPSWTNFLGPLSTVGTNFVVTNGVATPTRFFRLSE
jgi:hypothetical protein